MRSAQTVPAAADGAAEAVGGALVAPEMLEAPAAVLVVAPELACRGAEGFATAP